MKRRAAVVLFAVAAAIALCLPSAGATGRHHHGHRGVLVVDNQPRHHHRSCLGTRDPFETIQGAVNDEEAVPGATIFVRPGLYEETVKVWKPRLSSNDARNRLVGPAEGASAIYIGARTKDIKVDRNRVRSASGNGIDVTPCGEGDNDPLPPTPEDVQVTRNKVTDAKLNGLHMATGTAGVTVTGNTALDNGDRDCRDDSTGSGTRGTANTWTANVGGTSFPTGLCAPPSPSTDTFGHGKGHHKKHRKRHLKKLDPCACMEHHPRAV